MKGKGFLGVLVALAGLAGLTACEDGPMVTKRYVDPQGTWYYLTYAKTKGPILAKVEGRAFGQDAADIAGVVHDHMAAMLRGIRVSFTDDPARAGITDSYLRIAFGVPETWDGTKLCEDPDAPPAQDPNLDKVTVVGVYCDRTEAIAHAYGWARLDSPSDPGFGRMINGLSKSLFVEAKD